MASDRPSRPTLGRLARAGSVAFIGVGGASFFGWVRTKGLAVTLEPDGFGVYGQLSAFTLLVGTIATLGIGVGTTMLIAARRENGDRQGLSRVAALSLWLPLIVGFGLMGIALVLSPRIAPPLIDKPSGGLVALAALSIPFVAVQVPLQHVIQGFEDTKGQAIAYVVYAAGFTVAALAGALVAGVPGAVLGLLLGNALLAALYLRRSRWLVHRAGGWLTRRIVRPMRRDVLSGELIRIGSAALAITLAFSAADLGVRIAIVKNGGTAAAGNWYALLLISLQFVGGVYGSMTYLTAPFVSRSAALKRKEEVSRVVDDSVRLTLLTVVPLVGLLVALRGPLVGILFSDEFGPVARYIPAQMTGDLFRAVAWSLGVSLVPVGLTRPWLWAGIGTSLVFGAVGIPAAYEWGIGGGTAAWIIAWGAAAIATGAILLRAGFWNPSPRTLIGLALSPFVGAVGVLRPWGLGLTAVVVFSLIVIAVLTRSSEWAAASGWARQLLAGERHD